MNTTEEIIEYLKNYDGPPIKIMEVCGTHTASIFKNGIRSLISDKIKLISGPGCPVCVTPKSYIDQCIEYAKLENHCLITFGDMLKVTGNHENLLEAKARGAHVEMVYAPHSVLEKAQKNPEMTYVIAGVGFETTVPSYGLIIEEARKRKIKNVKFLFCLKTVIPALDWLCSVEEGIDGFIAPGHVSVIIGRKPYDALTEKYKKPFVVTGFEGEHILMALYDLVHQIEKGLHRADNLYKNVVKETGNKKALDLISEYFELKDSFWRGVGIIPGSGLYIKEKYKDFDLGNKSFEDDAVESSGCRCGEIILGRIEPTECPLFKTVCTPLEPYGACMVSPEGTCGIWYRNV